MHFGKVEGVHRVPPMGPRETGIFESSASFLEASMPARQFVRTLGTFKDFFFRRFVFCGIISDMRSFFQNIWRINNEDRENDYIVTPPIMSSFS